MLLLLLLPVLGIRPAFALLILLLLEFIYAVNAPLGDAVEVPLLASRIVPSCLLIFSFHGNVR
jgi:hypothetical protein